MAAGARIAIVGAGNLGSALAVALRSAGYSIESVIAPSGGHSLGKARKLAKEVGAQAVAGPIAGMRAAVHADVVWFCVPDAVIAAAARAFAKGQWKGMVALHSSGALTSDELGALREQGAAVASAHPLMTFVSGSRPSLAGVSFAIEGDAAGVLAARRIVEDMGGHSYPIRKKDKAAYHAWGTFTSPLLTALLATTEHVAAAAGMRKKAAKRRMIPILLQTLANYARSDAAGAFSGPIVRGDVDTVKRHLRVLRNIPTAREVYVSLALAALHHLPGKNKTALKAALTSAGKR